MPLCLDKCKKCVNKHRLMDGKKSSAVLRRLIYCKAEARSAQRRLGLHSGDSVCMAKARYCIAEARSAQQIWEARVCRVGGSWRPGVPSLPRESLWMVRIEIIWGHTVQWRYLGTPCTVEIFGDTLYSVDIHMAYNSISNSYLN